MTENVSNLVNIHVPQGYSSRRIQFYFWLGLVSATLLRLIIIADYYSGILSNALFYLGVIGYLVFFAHRYHVSTRRVGVLRNLELLEKISSKQQLSDKEYEGLEYVLWSLSVSKERLNYLTIFAFSIIAIVVSLMFDFGMI